MILENIDRQDRGDHLDRDDLEFARQSLTDPFLGDHLVELPGSIFMTIEYNCLHPVKTSFVLARVWGEAVREDPYISFLLAFQGDLPGKIANDELPLLHQRFDPGLSEARASFRHIFQILPLREEAEEGSPYFPPELACSEHQFALELARRAGVQSPSLQDGVDGLHEFTSSSFLSFLISISIESKF